MSDSMTVPAAWIELYDLSEPLEAREWTVLEAQARRVAAMLRIKVAASGALFAVDPQSYASVLARLADEAAA